MADKPMDTYLNDHLAGSTLGVDLAKQIRDRSEGRLRALMDHYEPLAAIDLDRLTERARTQHAQRDSTNITSPPGSFRQRLGPSPACAPR